MSGILTHYPLIERLSKRSYYFFGTVVLLLLSLFASAQNLSNRGKEFWVGYGHHQFMEPGQSNSQEMVLYLSAEQPANVTVRIFGTTWVRNYTIPANTVIATENIPKAGTFDARLYSVPPSFGGTGGEGVFSNKAIQIVSDVPIVAYAHIYGSASSGATTLMPVETWGYSYISVNSEQNYADNCFSWMYVIAKEDNTVVEITPSVPTRNGRPAGVPFNVTLNRGQAYQVVGAMLTGGRGNELTGTTVKVTSNTTGGCAPVAVYSGSSRTSISCTPGTGGSGDNNMQQVFPFQAWGKRYILAPTSNSSGAASLMTNIYKVVVKDPTTVVKRNGVVLTGLIANSYYQFNSNTADYIESDKPVLIAQFMASSGACPNTGGDGDPEMVYISPIEQAIKRIGFYRNTRESIRVNYLTLVIPTPGIASLTIDGVAATTPGSVYTYPVASLPGYSVVVKRWPAAQAQSIVQSDSAFTAVTYGLGSVESYGYNAGTLINNLNVVGSIQNEFNNNGTPNDFTCTRTPVKLSVLVAYQPTKMVWKISQLGAAITPNADVVDNAPVAAGTAIIKGVTYYKYTLPGTYQFSTTGNYEIPISSTHPSIENCTHTEDVKFEVIVKNKPDANFTYDFTGCVKDTVYLKASPGTGGFDLDRWKWEFPDGTTQTTENAKKVLAVGNPTVKLTVISKDGCVGTAEKEIIVSAIPVADFTTSVPSICEGSSITITDNSTYGGTAPLKSWYYDFGNGNNVTVADATPQTATYAAFNSYTVQHVVKVSDLCISDTVKKVIPVYAKPRLAYSFPQDCLPVDGIVQFTSNTTVPDVQTLATYAWNFGDANATPANPNTSAVANPTHTYSTFGTYTVKYTVTTDKGCSKDSVADIKFNLKPKLSFAPLTGVCINVKGPLSLANAKVENGVLGKGRYRGPGTDATGNFTPSVAGTGTHTIWYIFDTDAGCADSISTTIAVYPKPVATFTADQNVCLGVAANISDQSTGNVTSWKWSFGDGTTATYNTAAAFTRSYGTKGSYEVKLVAVSDNSCESDTGRATINVRPLPTADFALPATVCMPEGKALFTNQSRSEDNSALTYTWNFGDGSATTTDQNPTHIYAVKGPFNIVLTTKSAFGCTNRTEKSLDAFFDQPVAAFAVEPEVLCQGADNVFTDQSTAPNSTIKSWAWDFGDGTTATNGNPVKRYTGYGIFPVKLTVKNAAGCISEIATKPVTVYLQPVIEAGPSFVVTQGTIVTFKATANDPSALTFRWTPPGDLVNATVLQPTLKAMKDETYTLTATGEGNCTAKDVVTVKVLKPVTPPNAFTPNGDGINDKWVITNLSEYPGCIVEVFNRYGQRVFRSEGYGTAWDGTSNGKVLPLATYYYVIRLKNGFEPLTGYVTILK